MPRLHSILALFSCFCGRLITNGSVFCLGVYYNHIQREFNTSHTVTSLVVSLPAAMLQGSGIIVGHLVGRVSERQIVMTGGLISCVSIIIAIYAPNFITLLIFLGLLNGLGQGFVYVAVPVAGSYIFAHKYHHIAMALQNAGDGVGFFIFPVFYEVIINVYGWRNSLFIMAATTLQMVVCGALINPPDMKEHREEAHSSQLKSQKETAVTSLETSMWRNTTIYLLLVNALCHSIGFCIFFAFVFVHLTSELGVAEWTSAWIITAFGISSIFARLATMCLDNRRYMRRWSIFAFAHMVEGLAMVAFALTSGAHIWALVFLMSIIGVASGFIGALVCCVAMDLLGPVRLAHAFGYMMTFWGIGSLIGAPLGGIIRDYFDSYSYAIIVAGVIDAGGFLCLVPLLWTTGKYFKLASSKKDDVIIDEGEDDVMEKEDINPLTRSLINLYGGSAFKLNS